MNWETVEAESKAAYDNFDQHAAFEAKKSQGYMMARQAKKRKNRNHR